MDAPVQEPRRGSGRTRDARARARTARPGERTLAVAGRATPPGPPDCIVGDPTLAVLFGIVDRRASPVDRRGNKRPLSRVAVGPHVPAPEGLRHAMGRRLRTSTMYVAAPRWQCTECAKMSAPDTSSPGADASGLSSDPAPSGQAGWGRARAPPGRRLCDGEEDQGASGPGALDRPFRRSRRDDWHTPPAGETRRLLAAGRSSRRARRRPRPGAHRVAGVGSGEWKGEAGGGIEPPTARAL